MRLSPKSIFLGLVAFGLPFAVTVGWQFAGPPPGPDPISAPIGAGGIGAAPTRATAPTPLKAVDWSSPVAKTTVGSATPSVSPSPAGVPSAPSPAVSTATGALLPTLTLPPVPTPTDIPSPPPSPSATPSSSVPPESPDLTAARLVRRP